MPDQPPPVVYDGDTRYPGPLVHPPPEYIKGIPTQAELDAQARMFTWGELKEIISESVDDDPIAVVRYIKKQQNIRLTY